MMTPDKDYAQLVSDKVLMFKPAKAGGVAEVWGPDEVKKNFGIENTEQVIDILGLMGDAVRIIFPAAREWAQKQLRN